MQPIKVEEIIIKKVSQGEAPWSLLLEADPSRARIAAYLADSTCYTAALQDETVGVVVLRRLNASTVELMNIAVAAPWRNAGVGTRLLRHAILLTRGGGASALEVGTGAFGPQLAFYQRAGFRVSSIERDFFANNYEQAIFENGVRHLDMLRLRLEL